MASTVQGRDRASLRKSCLSDLMGRRQLTKVVFLGVLALYVCIEIAMSIGTKLTSVPCAETTVGWSPSTQYYRHGSIVYGHLHMAKTAGSTINAKLALMYERVCGHKGYSYNAYQQNQYNARVAEIDGTDAVDARAITPDTMLAWGYENCDYISMETGYWSHNNWTFWQDQSNDLYEKGNLSMELHIPCRDPLDHLMSLCNYRGIIFNCSNPDLLEEFWKCERPHTYYRFNINLTKLPHLTAKCFDIKPVSNYMDYMSQFLQPRRITADFVKVKTNEVRQKDQECIWKEEYAEVRQRMNKLMVETMDYYKYCRSCLGTKDDLLVNWK